MSKPLPDQIVLTTAEARTIEKALSGTIQHMVAFADNTPYTDDPRWSPWTRFQKRVADRCGEARRILREKQGA